MKAWAKNMSTTVSEPMNASNVAAKPHSALIASCFCGLICLAMLVLSVWALNKGFDLTDEGFYLLSHENPHLYICFTFVFHLLKLIPLSPSIDTIVQLRIVQLLSITIGATVLWWGVLEWGRTIPIKMLASKPFCLTLLFLTISGNLLTNAFLPQTISYNGATAFLVCCSAGLLFAAVAQSDRWSKFARLYVIVAGMMTGLCIFTKASTGICLFAAELVFILLFSHGHRIRNVAWYVASFAASIASVFCFVVSPHEFFTKLSMFPPDKTHTLPIMIKDYVSDFARNAVRGGVFSIPFLLICFKSRFRPNLFFPLFAIITLGVILYSIKTSFLAKVTFFYLEAVWFWAFYLLNKSGRKKEVMLGLAFLGLLPFISAAGTNRPLFVQASLCLGPWLLMTGLIGSLVCDTSKKSANIILTVTLIFTSSLLALQFFNGLFIEPYRNPLRLPDQQYQLADSQISDLKLDQPTIKELVETRELIEKDGFKKGDLIIGYNRPGLVYALSGQSVGLVWFNPDCRDANARAIRYGMPKTIDRLFLIIDWLDELKPETLKALEDVGAPYPRSFRLLGTTKNRFTHEPVYVFAYDPSTKK